METYVYQWVSGADYGLGTTGPPPAGGPHLTKKKTGKKWRENDNNGGIVGSDGTNALVTQ